MLAKPQRRCIEISFEKKSSGIRADIVNKIVSAKDDNVEKIVKYLKV